CSGMTTIHTERRLAPAAKVSTIVDLLRSRAGSDPDRTGYIYLGDDELESGPMTYADLDRESRSIAALLQERNLSGKPVLLLYPHGLEYIAAFFGCLYAGAIAVPAYPPRLNSSLDRLRAIVNDTQATLALTTKQILSRIDVLSGSGLSSQPLQWLTTD